MEINKHTKIGVLCGGISSEREISLRSGKNCFDALIRKGYSNALFIDIKKAEDLFLLKGKIEVAFLVTHGKYGEDGCIQGLLEWLEIPYTGSSPVASAITMDKGLTKLIAKSLNIPVPNAYIISKQKNKNLKSHWEELSQKNSAVFIKPVDDGSSVNTFKIKSFTELGNVLEKLFSSPENQSDYLIEEYIKGKEVTSSIIEVNNSLKFLPVLELRPKKEFYDYEAKYTKGLTEFILPAQINNNSAKKIESDSLKIFSEVGLSGFARVDFILDDKEIAYMLEVNSLPGMTDTSDLPAQAAEAGIKYDDLVEIILKSAKLHKNKKDSAKSGVFAK